VRDAGYINVLAGEHILIVSVNGIGSDDDALAALKALATAAFAGSPDGKRDTRDTATRQKHREPGIQRASRRRGARNLGSGVRNLGSDQTRVSKVIHISAARNGVTKVIRPDTPYRPLRRFVAKSRYSTKCSTHFARTYLLRSSWRRPT
jgi:hypothetical protein